MPDNYSSVLNALNDANYNYGTTLNTPVAEQNQTYFAYWNGVGGSRPEYINGSSYFIKYLIDINGNVVNPEPYTETTSIEAVALHNLKNNFEPGKRAIVKLIEPDPTQNETTDADALKGIHTIAHVGKIIPVLVTETGGNDQDYITTMSFGPTTTQIISTPGTVSVPNLSAQFGVTLNPPIEIDTTLFTAVVPLDTNTVFGSTQSWDYLPTGQWRILSSSIQTNTRIRFKFSAAMGAFFSSQLGTAAYVEIAIFKNDNFFPIWSGEATTDLISPNGDTFAGSSEVGWWTSPSSDYFDYNANDVFEVRIRTTLLNDDYSAIMSAAILYVEQEIPAASGTGGTTTSLISSVNTATSNYFISASNYPQPNNRGYSVLTFSPELTNIWNLGVTQNLDSASDTFGFSPITVPFSSLKPGDFIRFEYRKNQTYTIFDVKPTSSLNNENVLQLSIMPSLSTLSGSIDIDNFNIELNHFQIYRVLNDGLYVTLDVTPDWGPGGNALTGLLIPEFISQELSEKLETLIQDLTQKEIIQ